MTFEKAAIILLSISNLLALYVNNELFKLTTELKELFDQLYAINKKLIAWIERD